MCSFDRVLKFVAGFCGAMGITGLFYSLALLFVIASKPEGAEEQHIERVAQFIRVLRAGGILVLIACLGVYFDRIQNRRRL